MHQLCTNWLNCRAQNRQSSHCPEPAQVEQNMLSTRNTDNTLIPFWQVSVFHKIKFTSPSLDVGTIDALHIQPLTCNQHGTIPRRFNTAFVKVGTRFRVVQNGMYRVSKSHRNGRRLASILPLSDVCRSVQLFPTFGQVAPRNWQSPTVLEECRTFYVNPFLDRHLYYNLDLIKDNL
jgi:hypothetical protein